MPGDAAYSCGAVSGGGEVRFLFVYGCRGDFIDRDFVTASSSITSFSFSEKEKEGKRKTAQGVPPRSEPRFAPADRDEIKIRGSMRLRPPRPPGERASRESQTTEMLCTAEKVSVFGAKLVRSVNRAARPQPWLPLEGKLSAPAD